MKIKNVRMKTGGTYMKYIPVITMIIIQLANDVLH